MTPSRFREIFAILKDTQRYHLVDAGIIERDDDGTQWALFSMDPCAFVLSLKPVKLAKLVRLVERRKVTGSITHQCSVRLDELTGPHTRMMVYRQRQARATGLDLNRCMRHATIVIDGKWFCTQHGAMRAEEVGNVDTG